MHPKISCLAAAVAVLLLHIGIAPPAHAAPGTFVVGRAAGGDTSSVAYRRCSAGKSGDAGFLSARGAVLAELQGVDHYATASAAEGGGYKVVSSSSGPVHGVGQCLGGVPASACAACVSRAVAELAGTACAAALAADVYMVQCSVRYWANSNYFRSSQDNPGDDLGRTLAIIIGIMAGLALLVVFISFLRKACD